MIYRFPTPDGQVVYTTDDKVLAARTRRVGEEIFCLVDLDSTPVQTIRVKMTLQELLQELCWEDEDLNPMDGEN